MSMRTDDPWHFWIIMVCLLVMAALFIDDSAEQAEAEARAYCERVIMYEQDVANGVAMPRGHRDYDAAIDCGDSPGDWEEVRAEGEVRDE